MIFTLSPEQQQKLIAAAHSRFHQVLTHLKERGLDRGDTGGFLFLFTEELGKRFCQLALRVGEIPTAERGTEVAKNVAEKSLRLHYHPEHASAWESRNPAEQSYGGGIRVGIPTPNGLVLATLAASGTIEHGDETVLMLIADDMGYEYDPVQILAASDNKLYHELSQ